MLFRIPYLQSTKEMDNSLDQSQDFKQGVCHTLALPFTLKSVLRQMKNYGNSNILPCKYFALQKYNLQKNPLKEIKILQDIVITLL